MSITFVNERQHQMFDLVVQELEALGYVDEVLLKRNYRYQDWFAHEERQIPVAAFGQTPISYESACFGIVLSNENSAEVFQHRSLCAPVIFEISPHVLNSWGVIRDGVEHIAETPADGIRDYFADYAAHWIPKTLLRSKNVADFVWHRQLNLFAGWIPELEHQIQSILDPLLRTTLATAKRVYAASSSREPDEDKLFKLIFWLLTAKVFHDRNVNGFQKLDSADGAEAALKAVASHYKSEVPQLLNRDTREAAFCSIWRDMDFRHLSVEVLSQIWSETLVSDDVRESLGIHRTSRTLVKYIVDRLPLEHFDDQQRIILEPCCGGGAFLIGAMHRLRPLLWGHSNKERHRFFTSHLVGFEKDPFGVEISKLSLTLSDFPNPNNWQVIPEDVFVDDGQFAEKLSIAGIVLCNPPFEDFTAKIRGQYNLTSVKKPVELLTRILEHLHPQGILGFVLPRNILDGQGYGDVRRKLAERFASLEVTSLPDSAFEADHEVVLLLATDPIPHRNVRIVHRKVKDAPEDWNRFALRHEVSSEYSAERSIDAAQASLAIPDLPVVWEYLSRLDTLEKTSHISRGIEWNNDLTEDGKETGWRDVYVKNTPDEGYMEGVPPKATFNCFERPLTKYLCVNPKEQKGNPYLQPWDKPKVIVNKSTRSRGGWRLSAFADSSGLTCYQTFIGIWPREPLGIVQLAAILNGPIANAFVATREGKTDITLETLRQIPIPRMLPSTAKHIEKLVDQYFSALDVFQEPKAALLLKKIDATVLSAYDLPPKLERQVLDYFNGQNDKRAASAKHGDYFPRDFAPYFSLSEYLSPDFEQSTARNLLARMRQS